MFVVEVWTVGSSILIILINVSNAGSPLSCPLSLLRTSKLDMVTYVMGVYLGGANRQCVGES